MKRSAVPRNSLRTAGGGVGSRPVLPVRAIAGGGHHRTRGTLGAVAATAPLHTRPSQCGPETPIISTRLDHSAAYIAEMNAWLAVLGTYGAGRYDAVTAGIALQRVLLAAIEERLATSMLSQPIEIPATRQDLCDAVRGQGTRRWSSGSDFG